MITYPTKYLGILMPSGLSWSPNIRAIANKLAEKLLGCSVFFKLGLFLSNKSMVRSLLEYCCPSLESCQNQLKSIQEAFTGRISRTKDMPTGTA